MWQVIQDGLRVKFRIRHLLVVAVVVAVVSWLGSKYVHSLTALAEAKRSVAVPDDSFWLTDDEEKLLVFYDSSKLVAFEIQFQQRWLGNRKIVYTNPNCISRTKSIGKKS